MPAKSEVVYRDLRDRILSGEFSPGYRLVLSRVAEENQMSPVPVREALRRLEAEGLVRYTRNVGAEVVGVDESGYSDTMQALAYLEGITTALSAPYLKDKQLEEAEALNEEMRVVRTMNDPVRFTILNHDFHVLLASACPNQHLLDLLHREWDQMAHIRRSTFTFVPDRSDTSITEHDALIALVRAGASPDVLEQSARNHKLRTLEQFLALDKARVPVTRAAS